MSVGEGLVIVVRVRRAGLKLRWARYGMGGPGLARLVRRTSGANDLGLGPGTRGWVQGLGGGSSDSGVGSG